ncbi:LysR family transcriptional regulator [Lachnospiraceae bacterium OF09-6]|nr:LysR family transcriptional regulator [Lachnospiraceae bacterium OF09-6]
MDIRSIRYFMEAARELNITRAAENLHIAQPPLSRQIHQLEEELGVELFERKKKKLQLTEVGQLLLHRGDQIVTLVEKTEDEIRAFGKGVTGTLYLGTVEGSAPKMISRWVAEFSCRYPEVQYNLWNGSSDDVISRLSKGLCDLAVIAAPYDTERWEGIPVGSEPWAALIPHDHRWPRHQGILCR